MPVKNETAASAILHALFEQHCESESESDDVSPWLTKAEIEELMIGAPPSDHVMRRCLNELVALDCADVSTDTNTLRPDVPRFGNLRVYRYVGGIADPLAGEPSIEQARALTTSKDLVPQAGGGDVEPETVRPDTYVATLELHTDHVRVPHAIAAWMLESFVGAGQ